MDLEFLPGFFQFLVQYFIYTTDIRSVDALISLRFINHHDAKLEPKPDSPFMLQIKRPGYTRYLQFRPREGNTKSIGFSLVLARSGARVLVRSFQARSLIPLNISTQMGLQDWSET